MAHRIREAMKVTVDTGPLGGPGKIVEADETYFGKLETPVIAIPSQPHRVQKRGKGGGAEKRASWPGRTWR